MIEQVFLPVIISQRRDAIYCVSTSGNVDPGKRFRATICDLNVALQLSLGKGDE